MKHVALIAAGCLLFVGACSSGEKNAAASDSSYQAISALGDTLYAPPLTPEDERRFESELEKARADYENTPEDADALLRYGRYESSLGNYTKAVSLFSEGIENHPKDARFYRYRGHRYITLRKFDDAIDDLKRSSELIYGSEDQPEPPLAATAEGNEETRRTLHTSIWYHLGLAYYLKGSYDQAQNALEECLRLSTNDDTFVAASYWLYMALRRGGKDDLAGDVLDPVAEEMDILENIQYHKLLLVFKGVFKPDMLLEELQNSDALEYATLGYGLGNWHYINGREERARELFQKVYSGEHWPAFGYIAAEEDLSRLFSQSS
ncbi:tetratricopeptide repeat protein [Fodinibius sediminis]|nr:tetratricopeptide repeat protein [Fodinibius sediminis]